MENLGFGATVRGVQAALKRDPLARVEPFRVTRKDGLHAV